MHAPDDDKGLRPKQNAWPHCYRAVWIEAAVFVSANTCMHVLMRVTAVVE